MIIAMPIMQGQVGDGWGRAHDVVVADVEPTGEIGRWEEFEVRWDELHDDGGEGQHHARIARFLMDHSVQRVVTGHMGPGMVHMLEKMNVSVVQSAQGVAREVAAQYGMAGNLG